MALTLKFTHFQNSVHILVPDDQDLDVVLTQYIKKYGHVHIQSGDHTGLPPITNILIVTKPDPKLTKLTKDMTIWLLAKYPSITVFVDKKLQERSAFKYDEIVGLNPIWKERLQFWTLECQRNSTKQIHLAVTLGGDGTVLYTTWMFQNRVPPIVAFHLGSLGFLTNFDFENYRPTMNNIICGQGMNLNIRMRLQCSVYKFKNTANSDDGQRGGATMAGTSGSEDDYADSWREMEVSMQSEKIRRKVKEMDSKRGTEVADLGVCHENGQTLITRVPKSSLNDFLTPTDTWQVLNEVTVDRGSNAGMLQLELYVDGNPVTTILADGLVIATATGSTAYSLSIGGSLIHPDKNSIIISPIASHSLTARPMIIPGTKHLRIGVPSTSRTTAWASFDGRHRQELERGDSIMITASKYPATTICRRDQSTDWFTGLTQVLNWNSRVQQKPLVQESHL
ncbi:hypothetical protein BGZ58_010227 [Dissophora ornata]|nr:hypothetical protein BGZ58_010227 [Dissophora ornata]